MAKINLLSGKLLEITLSRLSQQLIENHDHFLETVLIGLQPRGIFLAERIKQILSTTLLKEIPLGYLDTTFYRDDFRRRADKKPLEASQTKIPFLIENKRVVLIDDVLYTGRTVRAAMSALMEYGRPATVELLVLIDRLYSRHLPIQANYIGKSVNTIQSQKVIVEWKEQGFEDDNIWLINRNEI
ncbi:MAG: bifunctional pyr operon transcriptional regulator/uracil phosphoribosyltransferase PyrR [Cytophagales bacterium]|nr:bifunctional pyr operon transcriptional regulator/uracil phosphoribosyltransferase PyrR [Cytophagales bacterium]MDW8385031.1 bifunctional pyr operon transcriptional regulator/uracil phosphoribosyltransferase PyrR [Flammeovirgaceae bacterium]